MTMMLVTGAAGFIGSHLVTRLQATYGADAVVGVHRSHCNLSNAHAVRALFAQIRPTAVFHLAASCTRTEDSESQQQQWDDTFWAGKQVIEQAAQHGVSHLFIAGSVEELGALEGRLAVDADATPRTTYGLCKSLLRNYAEYVTRQTALCIDWFRPFIVYGPEQEGDMFIPYMMRTACQGATAQLSSGVQQRDFLYIDDLIAWILCTYQQRCTTPAPQERWKIHHVGTGEATTVRAIAQAVQEEFPQATLELDARPRRPHEPLVQVAPTTPHSTDWRPSMGWREGIATTAAWWRTRARP
jgi:UDP-glucose 4-epimerase